MSDDDQLRRLLSDAVSEVEPENRLDELRASVHPRPKVVPMSRSRSWYAATGILATAAVIGVIAYVASVSIDKNTAVGPATDPGATRHPATATATDTASGPTSTATGGTATKAYAVYYVGTDPKGKPVLFREFHRGPASKPTAALAVDDLESTPLDPDYSTAWQRGWLKDAKLDPNAGVIFVTSARTVPSSRPAGVTPEEATAAVQQVVYTLQAAFHTRLPVQFVRRGAPVGHVLGVRASAPIAQGKILDTLSRVNISTPNEGDVVSGELNVTGVNNAFEGSVAIYLQRNGHKFLVSPTIGGWGPDKLFPWQVDLDLSKVAPGRYLLVAQNDDPSGRNKPEVDTRAVLVR